MAGNASTTARSRGSWRLEAGIVGAAALTLSAFLSVMMTLPGAASVEPIDHFIQADYDAFDRNFELTNGLRCDVGLAAQKICLYKSPVERDIVRGERLPDYIPDLGTNFRVVVETSLKDEQFRTVVYGQTLVLLQPRSRMVKDVLRLTAPGIVAPRDGPAQPKA